MNGERYHKQIVHHGAAPSSESCLTVASDRLNSQSDRPAASNRRSKTSFGEGNFAALSRGEKKEQQH